MTMVADEVDIVSVPEAVAFVVVAAAEVDIIVGALGKANNEK